MDFQFKRQPENGDPKWIWYPGKREAVNFYFFARKTFSVKGAVKNAVLSISAHTEYELFVNGRYVGRGPNPSNPYYYKYYDTYDVEDFLKEGINVFYVICHNYGVGTHWYPAYPGRLIADCEITTAKKRYRIISDRGWMVKEAKCWKRNSPRMMWSTGFTETFDFREYDDRWKDKNFDDSGWKNAEEETSSLTKPYYNLIPREIPFFNERPENPSASTEGNFTLSGIHAVSFDGIIPEGENRIGYAQTYFYADSGRELTLFVSSDDAFKVFLNNKPVLKQEYDEVFARTRSWRAYDVYEQHRHGCGSYAGRYGATKTKVFLRKGWNKILAALDHGKEGWGFTLCFQDDRGKVADLPFSCDKNFKVNTWKIAGPFPSSGLKDSLDCTLSDIADAKSDSRNIKTADYSPFNYEAVTDTSVLMELESRSILKNGRKKQVLNKGEFAIFDFKEIKVGFPQIEIEAEEEGILDVGYSYLLPENKEMHCFSGVRYVDRIYLRKGKQVWSPFSWRTLRYLHLSCRKGSKIKISRVKLNTVEYPVRGIADFSCSNNLLNEIWRRSVNNTRLIMRDGYSDCLRREQMVCNTSSFNYASKAAGHCFGDYALARKTLLQIIRTQDDTGWFDSHGPTATNNDEITMCFWWLVWLKDYYLYSGDITLLKNLFEEIKGNLRYFSKMENRYGLIDCRNENSRSLLGRIAYIDDSTFYYPNFDMQGERPFKGELFAYNVMYYAGLTTAAVIADELGYADEASFYRKKAERVKESSNKRFWSQDKKLYINWRLKNKRSEESYLATNIAAVYFNLPDKEKEGMLLNYLCKEVRENPENFKLTFGFYFYLLEILFARGEDRLALDLMLKYYGRWVKLDHGGTTFGEHFTLDGARGLTQLRSEHEVHGYGTSAHLHFYSNILGVKPLKPGFKEILVQPHPGNLERASGEIFVPGGKVRVAWAKKKNSFTMEIKVPAKIKCQAKPPEGCRNCLIKINGKAVK